MISEQVDVLKKPLVFGDSEQIKALRQAEQQAEWDALDNCDECDGVSACGGACDTCRRECENSCYSCIEGKDQAQLEKFREKYPNFTNKKRA